MQKARDNLNNAISNKNIDISYGICIGLLKTHELFFKSHEDYKVRAAYKKYVLQAGL